MIRLAAETGPFRDLVSVAVAALAAATSLAAAWRGRVGWQPFEQPLPDLANRVAGVIGAVCIALLWVFARDPGRRGAVAALAAVCGAVFVVCALAYSYLVSTYTYAVPPNRSGAAGFRLQGGFRLDDDARRRMVQRRVPSVEQFLKGSDYRPDLLWSPKSRGQVRLALTGTYLGLVVFGTVSLACAGILASG